MLLATDWAARGVTGGSISGACAISGLFDLRPLIETTINGTLALDVDRAAELSPMELANPGKVLHAFVGEYEGSEYMRQSRTITERWQGAFHVLPGLNHFTAIPRSPIRHLS